MGIEVRRGFLSFRMGETRNCLYALQSRTSSREYLVEREKLLMQERGKNCQ